MKKIEQGQSSLVNDTCNDCGSYADIGAVIDEFDTVLQVERVGDDAKAELERLAEAAKARFSDIDAEVKALEAGYVLRLTFEYSAEKMIFQMEHNL